nr:hypothetical protein [Tanacetum cinerariifolium]
PMELGSGCGSRGGRGEWCGVRKWREKGVYRLAGITFRIQQYLQLKHYALWEVIEFGDSYKVPANTDLADSRSGRTITATIEDMQKKKNDDMAFISSSKNNNNEDGNTVCVTTATTTFPTAKSPLVLGIKCTRYSHCQVKSFHWQYKFPLPVKIVATIRRIEMPLLKVCTDIKEKKKKLPVKDRWQLH